MFAGWLMTIVIICAIAFVLFRFLYPHSARLAVPDEERLNKKKLDLAHDTRRKEVLGEEVGVTKTHQEVQGDIVGLQEELKEMEK